MRAIENYTDSLYKSIKRELRRDYGFGCVTYKSTASHDDMDSKVFEKSAAAICSAIDRTNWLAIKDFYDLRIAGLSIEKSMFDATGGVNTQKGLIFLHTFLAFAYMRGVLWENLEEFIANFSKSLTSDYDNHTKAKIWEAKGLADIRYYPLSGFRDILRMVEDEKNNQSTDLILTLKLIATVDDTTTVKRSDIKTLREIQAFAASTLDQVDLNVFIRNVKYLNNYYIEKNISSGGVADLFTTIRTLELLKEDFDE